MSCTRRSPHVVPHPLTTPVSTINRSAGMQKAGVPAETRTLNPLLRRPTPALALLNKLTVSELAKLSNVSKSYISQVKNGKCPPSKKLLQALIDSKHVKKPEHDYIRLFLESREAIGCGEGTMSFYRERLTGFTESVLVYWRALQHDVECYLNSIPPIGTGLVRAIAHIGCCGPSTSGWRPGIDYLTPWPISERQSSASRYCLP